MVAQSPRLWVLRAPGEMVEYDAKSFAPKQTVKVPAEALKNPTSVQVNRLGQMLFAPALSLPLSEDDAEAPHQVWIWNGHAAATIDQVLKRKVEDRGSNKEVRELAPAVFLAADGNHLFWSGNDARRLEREEVDLSTATTWQAWQTDLAGGAREDLASAKLPDCRCPTGSCEESCPSGVVWVPDGGLEGFFLLTHFVAALGTSGTFTGVSRRLHRELPHVKCYSGQPSSGFHGLEGLKHMPTAIVPGIYDPTLADGNIWLETEDAYAMVRRLAREEGLLVGISSGCNVMASLQIARELKAEGRQGMIVTMLCDSADKYLSDQFWDEE